MNKKLTSQRVNSLIVKSLVDRRNDLELELRAISSLKERLPFLSDERELEVKGEIEDIKRLMGFFENVTAGSALLAITMLLNSTPNIKHDEMISELIELYERSQLAPTG